MSICGFIQKGVSVLALISMGMGMGSLYAQSQPALSSPLASGTGPGVHSPNSPFAPLPNRADVLPWPLLTDVKLVKDSKGGTAMKPSFSAGQQALDQKTQRVQGFMMPLEPGERQKHFLLVSVPPSCSFCSAGGPESMIEVKTRTPVKYTLDPVVVEGRFAVLKDDPYGLYYRVTDAVEAK